VNIWEFLQDSTSANKSQAHQKRANETDQKTLERRTSDRQCKANKMANETEQEAIERKASNMKQTARKRARTIVDAVIKEFVAKVKMGPDYVCTCCHRMMYV